MGRNSLRGATQLAFSRNAALFLNAENACAMQEAQGCPHPLFSAHLAAKDALSEGIDADVLPIIAAACYAAMLSKVIIPLPTAFVNAGRQVYAAESPFQAQYSSLPARKRRAGQFPHRPSAPFRLVKAMVFPVVMYGCESWAIKKAERRRIDAFVLWCWRRLLRVPWTARRSNQSILKEISPGCSLEGIILKLKLQYFGHLM